LCLGVDSEKKPHFWKAHPRAIQTIRAFFSRALTPETGASVHPSTPECIAASIASLHPTLHKINQAFYYVSKLQPHRYHLLFTPRRRKNVGLPGSIFQLHEFGILVRLRDVVMNTGMPRTGPQGLTSRTPSPPEETTAGTRAPQTQGFQLDMCSSRLARPKRRAPPSGGSRQSRGLSRRSGSMRTARYLSGLLPILDANHTSRLPLPQQSFKGCDAAKQEAC